MTETDASEKLTRLTQLLLQRIKRNDTLPIHDPHDTVLAVVKAESAFLHELLREIGYPPTYQVEPLGEMTTVLVNEEGERRLVNKAELRKLLASTPATKVDRYAAIHELWNRAGKQ